MLLWNIKYYSDLRYQGDDTMAERMELLMQHRESDGHSIWVSETVLKAVVIRM